MPCFGIMNEQTRSIIQQRWGSAVQSGQIGYTAVPNVLVRSQARLGLTTTEMVVILNLLLHWWEPENWPYPRVSHISDRMGVSPRTVERALAALQTKGLVERMPSRSVDGGPRVRPYNLSGLVEKLQARAAEVTGAGPEVRPER